MGDELHAEIRRQWNTIPYLPVRASRSKILNILFIIRRTLLIVIPRLLYIGS